MNVKAFLMENINNSNNIESEKIKISNRFIDENGEIIPFEIKSISESEARDIKEEAVTTINSDGKTKNIFDYEKYNALLVTKCTVVPDFTDIALQKDWEASDAEGLAKKMLTSGEYSRLKNSILKICGFVTLNDLAVQAKNV